MLCQDCPRPKKSKCVELCPEAETHVNQDYVEWGETPISVYTQGEELRAFDSNTGVDRAFLSPVERDVLYRLGQGKTRDEISKDLSMSRLYVRGVCLRLKNKALHL